MRGTSNSLPNANAEDGAAAGGNRVAASREAGIRVGDTRADASPAGARWEDKAAVAGRRAVGCREGGCREVCCLEGARREVCCPADEDQRHRRADDLHQAVPGAGAWLAGCR